MELDLERRPMLTEVLEAIGNEKRVATLEQITKGVAAKEIHKNIDASRSGVQRFVNDFKDAGLVETADGYYELTAKGEVVVEALADLDTEFAEFERERVRSAAFESSLSSDEIEEILQEVKEQKGD